MRNYRFLNLFAFIITVFINYAANAAQLNGVTTGEVSDAIPSLFTPAGYVFAIWGLIYLGLAGFVIFNVLPENRKHERLVKIDVLFWINAFFNSLWILCWHFQYFLWSLGIMLVILITLIFIYHQLEIGKTAPPVKEKILVNAPFSLYLGWISVATVANASALLVTIGWGGFGLSPVFWTVLMMIIAALLGVLMVLRRNDRVYAGVIIWALIGIGVAQSGVTAVLAASIILSLFLLGTAIITLRRPSTQKA
ncbi:MAG: tryptophan-rich sensory protein [Anaerolineaceae bacterium]|nr:tryptophan-rich sensory protein [Anaerolineaceae bacterium]